MANKSIVVSINGEKETNLRVFCSCGWSPSMGGAIETMLPLLKTLLNAHKGPTHVVTVIDPFLLLEGVNELPMVS